MCVCVWCGMCIAQLWHWIHQCNASLVGGVHLLMACSIGCLSTPGDPCGQIQAQLFPTLDYLPNYLNANVSVFVFLRKQDWGAL